MKNNTTSTPEELRSEIALLQAEIETLKARKSLVECVREAFSKEIPTNNYRRQYRKRLGRNAALLLEIVLPEADYNQLVQQAQCAAWIEQRLAELKRIGNEYWQKLNALAIVKTLLERAERAEAECERLREQLGKMKAAQEQQAKQEAQDYYDQEDGSDLEIDGPEWDDREY